MGKGQSQIWILEIGSEKFVIKYKKAANTPSADISQPYFNEMLQSQALGQDLTQELAAEGVEMPTFLFASGQISCIRFEEGRHPNETLLHDKLERFLPVVDNYISNQKSQLWAGIHSDAIGQTFAPTTTVIKTDNFIQRPDGIMVWVDPLYFAPIIPDLRAL